MRSRLITIFASSSALVAIMLGLALAPRPTPPAAPVKPPEPVVVPAPPPPAIPPPTPTLAPLPEVTLKEVPAHAVPDESTMPPPRSLSGLMAADAQRERHVSDEVANGASRGPLPAAPKNFAGAATVTGAAGLQVGTVPVQLFGVKPVPGARCGAAGTCDAAARQALAEKIAGGVKCQVPAPRPGIVLAFAICLDASGNDLSQYLIAQGLALADTGQTYDYAGAEAAARSLKRGLWAYR